MTLLQGLGFRAHARRGADAFGLRWRLSTCSWCSSSAAIMLVAGFTYVKDYNRARAMEA
ncbi:MAG: hypothetical protein ACLTTU_13295 [Bilophila wadsworthia]